MKEQSWLEEGWLYHNHAWHLLHEIIKTIPENTISMLDVGAGTGIAASIIKAVFPDIIPIVTDISEESKPFWDKRDIIGIVTTGKHLPFSDNQFDFVMSSHVLEHIEHPESLDFIKELFRVARRRITIVVPAGDVHFYDHKVIYDRAVLKNAIQDALYNVKYKFNSYPIYHPHLNNLFAVIDKG